MSSEAERRYHKYRGYKIYGLSESDCEFLTYYRLDKTGLSNFYLSDGAYKTYVGSLNKEEITFRKSWGFPSTGNYLVYVLNCYPSEYNSNEYIIEFLANMSDVCKIKFEPTFNDKIYNAVKNDLGWEKTIFNDVDFGALKGMAFYLSVENIKYKNSYTEFSAIREADIIPEERLAFLINVIEQMLSQV